MSPMSNTVMPRLPDCSSGNITTLEKKTKAKFFMCTMFKDEEGFLAEFVAFYKVHGFNHIILWNHQSSDNFYKELAPWIRSGFVEIRNTSTITNETAYTEATSKLPLYWKVMHLKKEIERRCMKWGFDNKYDFYLTADIDEYVVPMSVTNNIAINANFVFRSIADTAVEMFRNGEIKHIDSGKQLKKLFWISLTKYNFNSAPHLLEPIDQLGIEAYTSRYYWGNRITFYAQVQKKFLYRLSGSDITDGPVVFGNYTHVQKFMSSCCFFHGCSDKSRDPKELCNTLRPYMSQEYEDNFLTIGRQHRKHAKVWLHMNHYARSLEKFQLKQATWQTASQETNSYDLSNYMSRTYGWIYDPTAVYYGCAVRYEINRAKREYIQSVKDSPKFSLDAPHDPLSAIYILEMPQSDFQFLRQGENWYRNPEFGVAIASKLKQNGDPSLISVPHNPSMVCNLYERNNHALGKWYADGQCGVERNNSASPSRNMFLDFYKL